ncbi:HNH endonuclease, partial [Enterobacter hormaechei]
RNGRYTPAETVDHIKPKAHGGTDDLSKEGANKFLI